MLYIGDPLGGGEVEIVVLESDRKGEVSQGKERSKSKK